MKNRFTLIRLCSILLCAVVFSSCVKRDLEYRLSAQIGTLELTLNWPDGVSPLGARLLVYTQDGALHKDTTLSGVLGSVVFPLAQGDYRIIVHNTDHSNIGFASVESHSTALALAGLGEIPKPGSELVAPGNIYGTGEFDQGVKTVAIRSGETSTISSTPVRLTHEVKFLFKVTGLDEITALNGRLLGVSPGVILSTGESLKVTCAQQFVGTPFAVRSRAAANEIQYKTTMEFFDILTHDGELEHTNQLEVAITDGTEKTYSLTTDIATIIQDIILENGGTLPIEIPLELKIEIDPITHNITATVTTWDDSGSGEGNPRSNHKK